MDTNRTFASPPKGCYGWLYSLAQRSGLWVGGGINHSGERFTCELVLRPAFSGFLQWFRAEGDSGEVFHEEVLLLGFSTDGVLSAACLNSNVSGLQLFGSDDAEAVGLCMTHGDMADVNSFRERVTLEKTEGENAIQYKFAWAMPGEEISLRSSAQLRPSSRPPSAHATSWLGK